jgi:hypothetical protein
MIDTVFNLLFRCSHQRMTRPMTPASKKGEGSGETYVVCLECGKQFSYDFNEMRIGKPVPASPTAGVLPPGMPKGSKKFRYAALASIIPLAWVIGKSIKKSTKSTDSKKL